MSTARNRTHKLAGAEMSGAETIIQVCADEGVDTIFGYSGGAILPTYDAIFRYNQMRNAKEQIRLIVPANEQGAGFMAAGYARASGKVGVLMVTSGPGATNTVTPIRDCMADSIPVVMISGQVPCAAIGSDAFQEAPVFNIMSACSKHVFLCKDPGKLEETMRTAFKLARSGRPGPVVVDVPKDVQNAVQPFKGAGYLTFRGYEQRMAALSASRISKEHAAKFFKMLEGSARPLIYAGGGVITANAAMELRKFAKRFNIPVVTTLMGIGSMDTADELSLHMLGMHGTAYANYAVEDCDFLLAVGARFDDRVAGKVDAFAPRAKHMAHIDIDAAEIGKVKAVDWAHVGCAKQALQDLLAHGRRFKKDFSRWVNYVNVLKKKHHLNYDRESKLIQPYEVIEFLNEITQGEAIVCTGVGQHQMWSAQYCRLHHPRSFITSGSMGTMGFGLPASIGAQVASPGRTVIDIDGDGSIRMNLGELETLTTYNVPVKILLLNNLGDGMVRQWQSMYFGERYSGTDKSLHRKDFVKAAEADGFTFAQRLTKRTDMKKVLKKFVTHNGPALLEVMIDPYAKVFPMVGPGLGYGEMITGEFIVPRETPPKEQRTEETDMMRIPELF
ncbi:MAG TPA: biosynthetic-type acetolactate synthase large subunit [Candidatus Hydrogenedentes bacterium]|nr:biosynthetic-type acetolactate synthase large subunit [Candidatus Hydrogenedentota bacterium]HQE82427.1 biosynthetic-type acetolactate synthase large subunit [Candidatus Hydrogenedentota bacterium]HQH51643.1 biosynthetic-type acetolactate synthase large subunit [Candidatus Hydrogenedentota bacterium]HQM50443.1 biosynthetic-type acetolactate synthase large subunit [Candidatus Hydrogenedentota bacterium]